MDRAHTTAHNARLSRRLLLGGVAAGAADVMLARAGAAAPFPFLQPDPTMTRTVMQVHGFHAAPDRGGGLRVDFQISDMKVLGASSATILLPTKEYLEKAADARLRVISRLHFDSIGDVLFVLDDQLTIHRGIQAPIFQVANEIDQEGMGGKPISPEQFNRDIFLPVVKATRDFGGTVLIPPMAPGSPTEDEYLDRLLRAIRGTIPAEVIRESLGLGIHNYFLPGQEPLDRVRKIYRKATSIVGPLPIYITEAGLNQDRTRFFSDAVIRDETLKYLQTSLGDLPIVVNDWWLIGNRVFRSKPLPGHEDVFADFETYAWRKSDTATTPVYDAVAQLALRSRRERGTKPGGY